MTETNADALAPLHGIRVLDFGRYIAGPYCATLLAEYGADVIRIEKRDGSEDRFVSPVGADGDGALFLQMARNKRSLTLDPMTTAGREVVANWSRARTWWWPISRSRRFGPWAWTTSTCAASAPTSS